jgi:serine/threonine protein kinase
MPSSDTIPHVGELIDRRYVIKALIAEGGMTLVYAANDLEKNETVALKFINDIFQAHPKANASLQHEAAVLSKLNHPSIIKLLREGEHLNHPFLVLQYHPGVSLKRALKQPQIYVEGKNLRNHLSRQLKEVVTYLHRSDIVHGDLKPENFLLHNGEIQLIDFGLARYYQNTVSDFDPRELQSYTPAYASDAIKQGHPAMPEDDLYALDKILEILR